MTRFSSSGEFEPLGIIYLFIEEYHAVCGSCGNIAAALGIRLEIGVSGEVRQFKYIGSTVSGEHKI